MKRHGHLFEHIVTFENLLLAVHKAQRGKRARPSVAHFLFHLEPEVLRLQEALCTGAYRMQPYRSLIVYEPKQRQICVAAFRDRVVHHAICTVLEPIFEASMIHDTYACRRGKGTHTAMRRAQAFVRTYSYVLKCDIRHYFASIDHEVLKTMLRRKLKDAKLLTLLDRIIDHPIPGGAPGKGIPIGNLTSQYFANLYLGELDHYIKTRLHIKGYVRYMDDFLLWSGDKLILHESLAAIRAFLQDVLQLRLKDEVTRIVPVTQGVSFVGFRIFPSMVRLDRRKWISIKRKIRARETQYACGMISEESLAQSVASMIGHMSHANTLEARRSLFAESLVWG